MQVRQELEWRDWVFLYFANMRLRHHENYTKGNLEYKNGGRGDALSLITPILDKEFLTEGHEEIVRRDSQTLLIPNCLLDPERSKGTWDTKDAIVKKANAALKQFISSCLTYSNEQSSRAFLLLQGVWYLPYDVSRYYSLGKCGVCEFGRGDNQPTCVAIIESGNNPEDIYNQIAGEIKNLAEVWLIQQSNPVHITTPNAEIPAEPLAVIELSPPNTNRGSIAKHQGSLAFGLVALGLIIASFFSGSFTGLFNGVSLLLIVSGKVVIDKFSSPITSAGDRSSEKVSRRTSSTTADISKYLNSLDIEKSSSGVDEVVELYTKAGLPSSISPKQFRRPEKKESTPSSVSFGFSRSI